MRACLVVVLGVAVLCGCGAMGAQNRQADFKTAASQANTTCVQIYMGDQRLRPLTGLLPGSPLEAPTFEMLANKRTPQGDEIPAVKARAEDFLQCESATRRALIGFATAQHAAVFDAWVNTASDLYVRLYNGDISYGEWLRAAAKSTTERNAAIAEIDSAIAGRNAQAAAQAQQSYLQAQQNYLLQQAARQNTQQSRSITCFTNGAYTTCN